MAASTYSANPLSRPPELRSTLSGPTSKAERHPGIPVEAAPTPQTPQAALKPALPLRNPPPPIRLSGMSPKPVPAAGAAELEAELPAASRWPAAEFGLSVVILGTACAAGICLANLW